MRDWGSLVAALLGAAMLAICATTPPPPLPTDAPPAMFSAARAMADVREIARAPHPTGSADNARVRAWLAGRLRSLGLAVRETPAALSVKGAEQLRKWSGSAVVPPLVNIVATRPGGPPGRPAVVLMAHYDSVWGSPGAADDGAGVAAALEIARALKGVTLQRPLTIVLTDGEELGLEGARALFAVDAERARIGAVVNLEARGGGGRAAMFETGRDNGAMMRLFDRTVARPSATSLSVLIYELLPNATDFTPAKARGLPGFNFAFIGRPGLYHSPLATADNLDQGALQDLGGQALDIVRALLTVPDLPTKAPNLVFFDIFGWFLIAYPAIVGWGVLAAAVMMFAAAALSGRVALAHVLRGVAAVLAITLIGGGLLFLFNLVSGAGGPVNYYDRLAAIPQLQLQALLIGTATIATVAALFGRYAGVGVTVGMALPLLLLALVLQIVAPTAAFVVAWPMLLAGAGLAAVAFARLAGTSVAVVTAALGAGYLLGLSFFVLQAIGPDTPSAVALPLAMIAVLLWPLIPPVSQRKAVIAAGALLVAAAGVALSVRLDPIAPSVATYSLKG